MRKLRLERSYLLPFFSRNKFLLMPLEQPEGFMLKVFKSYPTTGKRLLFLRSLTGKTRDEISKTYGIPVISLRQLELDKYNLRPKMATRLHEVYKQEGIVVPLDWILWGNIEPNR